MLGVLLIAEFPFMGSTVYRRRKGGEASAAIVLGGKDLPSGSAA
jgi:hypothetical protein